MISVLVADDQELLRDGFRALLETDAEITVVAEAGDGRQAVEQARRSRPDVVLMDIRMPVLDGVAATREIVDAGLSRVLVLTTFDEDELVAGALRAGASGFLLKSTAGRKLVDAVKAVVAGESLLAPEITRRLIERFVVAPSSAVRVPADLSDREVEVLRAIARGLSNSEIATELFLSVATVKSHINTLFAKLGVRDRANAVVFAYESGLVLPGDR